MKMMENRREGPASSDEPIFTFENFFDSTRAEFVPCKPPDREPDFISAGRSVYWNTGNGVIRSSDHWSGQNGRVDIASCHWTYAGYCRAEEWETGFAAWSAFRRRRRVHSFRDATELDLQIAKAVQDAGGGLDAAEWRRMFPACSVPDWARLALAGTLAAAPAADMLAQNPGILRVLTADTAVVEIILETAKVRERPRIF